MIHFDFCVKINYFSKYLNFRAQIGQTSSFHDFIWAIFRAKSRFFFSGKKFDFVFSRLNWSQKLSFHDFIWAIFVVKIALIFGLKVQIFDTFLILKLKNIFEFWR